MVLFGSKRKNQTISMLLNVFDYNAINFKSQPAHCGWILNGRNFQNVCFYNLKTASSFVSNEYFDGNHFVAVRSVMFKFNWCSSYSEG